MHNNERLSQVGLKLAFARQTLRQQTDHKMTHSFAWQRRWAWLRGYVVGRNKPKVHCAACIKMARCRRLAHSAQCVNVTYCALRAHAVLIQIDPKANRKLKNEYKNKSVWKLDLRSCIDSLGNVVLTIAIPVYGSSNLKKFWIQLKLPDVVIEIINKGTNLLLPKARITKRLSKNTTLIAIM